MWFLMNAKRKKEIRNIVFKRDGHVCLCCGSTSNLTLDHVLPLCNGGSWRSINLQCLCEKCNHVKANNFIDYRKDKPHRVLLSEELNKDLLELVSRWQKKHNSNQQEISKKELVLQEKKRLVSWYENIRQQVILFIRRNRGFFSVGGKSYRLSNRILVIERTGTLDIIMLDQSLSDMKIGLRWEAIALEIGIKLAA